MDSPLIFITMAQKYIALPFPDYQEYMEEEWFGEETYYDFNRDVYLIPIDRVHITSIKAVGDNQIPENYDVMISDIK